MPAKLEATQGQVNTFAYAIELWTDAPMTLTGSIDQENGSMLIAFKHDDTSVVETWRFDRAGELEGRVWA